MVGFSHTDLLQEPLVERSRQSSARRWLDVSSIYETRACPFAAAGLRSSVPGLARIVWNSALLVVFWSNSKLTDFVPKGVSMYTQ